MVRRGRRKRVDPLSAPRYLAVGESLLGSAEALATLAEEGDRFGNAIGILAVHAAIGFADALSISYGGVKSVEGDHERSVDALRVSLGPRADARKLRLLSRTLGEKDALAYAGEYYTMNDARRTLRDAKAFWSNPDSSTAGR